MTTHSTQLLTAFTTVAAAPHAGRKLAPTLATFDLYV